jgi:hypothetical protein
MSSERVMMPAGRCASPLGSPAHLTPCTAVLRCFVGCVRAVGRAVSHLPSVRARLLSHCCFNAPAPSPPHDAPWTRRLERQMSSSAAASLSELVKLCPFMRQETGAAPALNAAAATVPAQDAAARSLAAPAARQPTHRAAAPAARAAGCRAAGGAVPLRAACHVGALSGAGRAASARGATRPASFTPAGTRSLSTHPAVEEDPLLAAARVHTQVDLGHVSLDGGGGDDDDDVGAEQCGGVGPPDPVGAATSGGAWESAFQRVTNNLREEGRYRVFQNVNRVAGGFPHAVWYDQGGMKRDVITWCTNDYLGMGQTPPVTDAMHGAISTFGAGSGGTRNISGTNQGHVELEDELAELHNKEAALVFSSCYVANDALLSVLPSFLPGLQIFSDEGNHASIIQGIQHAKQSPHFGGKAVYRHNDLEHLEEVRLTLSACASFVSASRPGPIDWPRLPDHDAPRPTLTEHMLARLAAPGGSAQRLAQGGGLRVRLLDVRHDGGHRRHLRRRAAVRRGDVHRRGGAPPHARTREPLHAPPRRRPSNCAVARAARWRCSVAAARLGLCVRTLALTTRSL